MAHEIKINDANGRTQKWWINFMVATHTGAKITDIEAALKEYNAEPVLNNDQGDSISFKTGEDLTWFLLKWS